MNFLILIMLMVVATQASNTKVCTELLNTYVYHGNMLIGEYEYIQENIAPVIREASKLNKKNKTAYYKKNLPLSGIEKIADHFLAYGAVDQLFAEYKPTCMHHWQYFLSVNNEWVSVLQESVPQFRSNYKVILLLMVDTGIWDKDYDTKRYIDREVKRIRAQISKLK